MTALPAWRAFVSYFVVGRVTEITQSRCGLHPAKPRLGVSGLGDVRGVTGVVGGGVQQAARSEPVCDERDCRRLQQPPLVVAAFGQGRERKPEPRQRSGRDQLCQYIDGVTADQPDVAQVLRCTAHSNCASPRRYTSTAITSMSGSACAIATVDVPAPQPISSTTGAVRPNQAAVSSG